MRDFVLGGLCGMVLFMLVTLVLRPKFFPALYTDCEMGCAKEQARWTGRAEGFSFVRPAWIDGFECAAEFFDGEPRFLDTWPVMRIKLSTFLVKHDINYAAAMEMSMAWANLPCRWLDNERVAKSASVYQETGARR